MTKKKRKILLIGLGVVVLGGFVTLSAVNKRQPSTEVRLEKVGARNLTAVVTASGKLEPKRKVDVSSDITGRIVALPLREGEMVERGAVVVRIDPTEYQAGVERAEAMLASAQAGGAQALANRDQAERAFVRARDLRASNAQLISQEALEQAETQRAIALANYDAAQRQVDQARATLREAQDRLSKTTLRAPMSGRITRLAVEEGEVAVPGTFSRETGLLLTIADLSVIQVTVNVDETDVVRIHLGDSAEITIDAFPDTVFSGRVTKVSNSSIRTAASSGFNQDQAVDYEVEVTLDRPPVGVRPDLSATARIITATRRGVLAVPIIALAVRPPADTLPDTNSARGGRGGARRSGDSARPADSARATNGPPPPPTPSPAADTASSQRPKDVEGVFVVDTVTNQARFRAVRTGITGDEYFEVLSGLREGETIVAGPFQVVRDLKNNTKVRGTANRGGPGAPVRR
jgi:HlyD family secretion protein